MTTTNATAPAHTLESLAAALNMANKLDNMPMAIEIINIAKAHGINASLLVVTARKL